MRLIDADELITVCDIMAELNNDATSVWHQIATIVRWSPTIDDTSDSWHTETPDPFKEYLVSVVDDGGDRSFRYVTTATFFPYEDGKWIKDDDILYRVEGWKEFPKPMKKEAKK